jgi:hypothetical protein
MFWLRLSEEGNHPPCLFLPASTTRLLRPVRPYSPAMKTQSSHSSHLSDEDILLIWKGM